MKKQRLVLSMIGCILASAPLCSASTNLPFGKVVSGSITSAGGINVYTFSANTNDVIVANVLATSGSLSPELNLYSPSGELLTSIANRYGDGACAGGSVIELGAYTLPTTGTYTVTLSDCSATNTGNYGIYSQRVNNPSGAANLPFAQVETGSISSATQDNTYTFSANANDVFAFTMVTTSGGLSPRIRLYTAAGVLLDDVANRYGDGACAGGSVLELNTGPLPKSGTYTVLVGDCSDTNTGNYDIYTQRANNPSEPLSLSLDKILSGNISSATQSNTYTFNAVANDVIDFTMTATGNLSPRIRLYSPTGALLDDVANRYGDGACAGGSVLELNTGTLSTSGRYTVLVGDCSDTNTGNYDLWAQLTQDPLGAGNLSYGQTQAGTIGSSAQDNTYTFGANANDVIDFTLAATPGSSLSPRIRVYNSAGTLLADVANRYGDGACAGGSVIELDTLTIPTSDTYTALVGDCSDTNTGSYLIYSQLTNRAFGAATLLFGQAQTGNIAGLAQNSSYVFHGGANDVVDFTMVATSGSMSPRIRLYSPGGALLSDIANRYGDGACAGGSVVEVNTVTLPSNGTYVVLVGDCSDTNTGDYVIYGQRTDNPFSPAALLFGGSTQSASIVSPSQDNTFTFSGVTNNTLDFTMVATSGGLSPRIRLYSPSGALLDDAANRYGDGACAGGSTVDLDSVTLPENGIYTVLTGDCSDTNAGKYNLSTLCFGTCLTMPQITWANPAAIKHGTALSSTQLDATSPVAGAFTYTPAAGTMLAAGPQNLSVILTPTDTSEYSTAEDSVQLTVNSTSALTLSSTSLNFGNQLINTTSAAQIVTMTNTGTAAFSIYDISVGDDYSISAKTCGSSLAVGAKCSVSITFKPSQLNPVIGVLTFNDSGPGSPQTVTLSGTGTEIKLSPATLTFATQLVKTTSAAQMITVTNVGISPASITGISLTGSDPGDFAQTHTCGSSLAGGASCTISVTFTPTAYGTWTANVSITDAGGGSPQLVSLTGTATKVKLSATSLTFPATKVGSKSSSQTVTLTNVGITALSITSVSLGGTEPSDFSETNTCGSSVAAGDSCTLTITFGPKATGTRAATVSITDNGGASPQQIKLAGTGD